MAGAAELAGCSSGSFLGDHIPTAIGGLPEGAPERPGTPMIYPAVHDMPPPRNNTTLSEDEKKKLEGDLIAARNRLGASVEPTSTDATEKQPAGSQPHP